jgi:hypothetical protein
VTSNVASPQITMPQKSLKGGALKKKKLANNKMPVEAGFWFTESKIVIPFTNT